MTMSYLFIPCSYLISSHSECGNNNNHNNSWNNFTLLGRLRIWSTFIINIDLICPSWFLFLKKLFHGTLYIFYLNSIIHVSRVGAQNLDIYLYFFCEILGWSEKFSTCFFYVNCTSAIIECEEYTIIKTINYERNAFENT